jgi:hypothetical protein
MWGKCQGCGEPCHQNESSGDWLCAYCWADAQGEGEKKPRRAEKFLLNLSQRAKAARRRRYQA